MPTRAPARTRGVLARATALAALPALLLAACGPSGDPDPDPEPAARTTS
ncbi:serine hydrolase, partial [Cellulomonas hominis]